MDSQPGDDAAASDQVGDDAINTTIDGMQIEQTTDALNSTNDLMQLEQTNQTPTPPSKQNTLPGSECNTMENQIAGFDTLIQADNTGISSKVHVSPPFIFDNLRVLKMPLFLRRRFFKLCIVVFVTKYTNINLTDNRLTDFFHLKHRSLAMQKLYQLFVNEWLPLWGSLFNKNMRRTNKEEVFVSYPDSYFAVRAKAHLILDDLVTVMEVSNDPPPKTFMWKTNIFQEGVTEALSSPSPVARSPTRRLFSQDHTAQQVGVNMQVSDTFTTSLCLIRALMFRDPVTNLVCSPDCNT